MIELPGYIRVPQSVIDLAHAGQAVCVRDDRNDWWVVYCAVGRIDVDTMPKDEWDYAPPMGYLDHSVVTLPEAN